MFSLFKKKKSEENVVKETWCKQFGWFPIVWIYVWGVAMGVSAVLAFNMFQTLVVSDKVVLVF